ncbi:choline dehydrogenase-like flavoprotein [Neorhizobium huautlense]|uniref:Choline dehydrogenase-like flavoprotein n=1 Tax=Neorhizobium huautlense TaxID=67774 RepID=A0ABT9PLW7_9HYPH|nr:GMC oxidoreductase [Neorhizobium huautlense]MDP9835463.1 choline dehydrogenase-like flavoprotein [Neorhizobium huautlense]
MNEQSSPATVAELPSPVGAEETHYDYIVIGSGAGGGPLAARLALAGQKVLVIEAGSDTATAGQEYPEETYTIPAFHAAATEDKVTSWDFSVRHYGNDSKQAEDNKYDPAMDPSRNGGIGKGGIFYPRAAALGGCTSHHAMIIIRPNDSDWEDIADRTGDQTWRSEHMQGYFPKIENCLYYAVYRGYFGKFLRLVQWVAAKINPAVHLDPNGHGHKGWQPTSFIDPLVIAAIVRGDRVFLKLLFDVVWSALSGRSASRAFKEAATHLQILQFLDPNARAKYVPNRAHLSLISIGTDGSRRIGLREWLLKVANDPKNALTLKTDTHATRLIFEKQGRSDPPRAVGVEVELGANLYKASRGQRAPTGERRQYFANKEVIVSGGSFNTPQLLMLSGIGDATHLKKMGIDGPRDAAGDLVSPVINLPGVGRNLQDRYEVSVVSELKQDFSTLKDATFQPDPSIPPGDPDKTSDPLLKKWRTDHGGLYATNGGALAFMMSSNVNTRKHDPDLFVFGIPAAFRGYYWGWSKELLWPTKGAGRDQRDLWSWVILKAYTDNNQGLVRLRTADPFDVPDIDFNSFPRGADDKDAYALVETVGHIRDTNLKIKGLRKEIQPGKDLTTAEALNDWVRQQAWGHHACGTCRMGRDPWRANVKNLKDEGAVLDSKFRVHGVERLRVVDASVFPRIPGYFIVTPVFMIGEKAADTILADHPTYPESLVAREAAAVKERRIIAEVPLNEPAATAGTPEPALPQDCIGLALSGGGIRSATYSLGVLQALARNGVLKRIDFLSTVSGGGFIGGFLGRLFTRLKLGERNPQDDVAETLTNQTSSEVWWLRRNADYLIGGGRSDFETDIAIISRNLTTMLFCIAALAVTALSALRWLADTLFTVQAIASAPGKAGEPMADQAAAAMAVDECTACNITSVDVPSWMPNWLGQWIPVEIPNWGLGGIEVSPWWIASVVIALASVIPLAVGYWLLANPGSRWRYSLTGTLSWTALLGAAIFALTLPSLLLPAAVAIVVLLLAWVLQEVLRWRKPPAPAGTDYVALYRNRLSRALGSSLFLLGVSVVFVLLDSFARYFSDDTSMPFMAATVIAAPPFLLLLRSIVTRLLPRSTTEIASSLPPTLRQRITVNALSFGLAAIFFIAVDALVHHAFNRDGTIGAWLFGAAFFVSLAMGHAYKFANLSSLQQSFTQKLTRTFLGASNNNRVHPLGPDVAVPVQVSDSGDDIFLTDYHPERHGGPLHLINVCLNETVDYQSGRQLRGNKGLAMALGPCGISVGTRYHALWKPEPEKQADAATSTTKKWVRRDHRAVEAIPVFPDPNAFHPFESRKGHKVEVEQLTVGRWMAISAAAKSTGAGRYTSLPMALLLGLLNIRLGYWWNSGLSAGDRPGRYPPGIWRKIKSWPAWLFAVQAIILNEWRARFEGPNAERWYLSDDGHFENTGVYELIRRRLPLIIAIDAGADPKYQMEDVAILMRQVRLDFGAEITWLDPGIAIPGASPWAGLQNAAQALPNAIKIPDFIQEVIKQPLAIGSLDSIKRNGPVTAAFARVCFRDAQKQDCWLLFIKANLAPKVPADVTNYAVVNEAFPNQSTLDQFFQDDQWESYRSLGECAGNSVFG